MNILVICEKPSMAQSIAAVLGANQRKESWFEGGGWIVSWCYGHLVELAPADAYGEQYKRWSYASLPILPDVWQYRASEGKQKQFDTLHSLMNRADVDFIVNACDAGREGQLIYGLVHEQCKTNKEVRRLWISSLEDSAIRDGFAKLRPGADFDNLYCAALCRAKADYLIGINMTRMVSCLYGFTLTVGRVQSPTLALLVEREAAIQAFVAEPFYTPEIDCGGFTASGEKLYECEAAETVRAAADGRDAVVLSIEKQRKTTAPPKLFDLTSLQREANRRLGYTAQQTTDYLQSLYTKKYTTYPRTDAKYITDDMRGTVREIIGEVDFMPDIDRIIGAVSDHYAIVPTLESRNADISALPSGERNVFELVRDRLIAAVSPEHVYEAITVTLECGGHKFVAKGKTVIEAGWKIQPDEDDEDTAALPEFAEGQIFQAVSATIKEGKSAPKPRYTEDTLLSAMESAGLGTPATRAATIEKIIKTGFVERVKKALVPTDKAANLIAVLPDALKSPELTAIWEQKLGAIERGELTDVEFMDGIATFTRELVAAHSAPLPEYADVFAPPPKGEIVGDCPRCKSPVTVSNKGYFCSSRACKFALWRDNRFFEAKRKTLDKTTAAALLAGERVLFSDLYSERTGKTYAAAILLDDDGTKTNFKLEFDGGQKE